MKIAKPHYNVLREEIAKLNRSEIKCHYVTLSTDLRVKNIDKRLRWDLTRAAGLTPYICSELYPYLDDTHIDTALRSIVKELSL